MIKCDVTDFIKSLELLHKDVVRRLEQVVTGFAYEFTMILSNNTPISTEESIQKFKYRYQQRAELGIESDSPGYHRGSWQVDLDKNFQLFKMISTTQQSADDAENFVQQYYKLGQPIYIGANTPGMEALEFGSSNQAPDGISDMSVAQIMATYGIDAVRYYNQG